MAVQGAWNGSLRDKPFSLPPETEEQEWPTADTQRALRNMESKKLFQFAVPPWGQVQRMAGGGFPRILPAFWD